MTFVATAADDCVVQVVILIQAFECFAGFCRLTFDKETGEVGVCSDAAGRMQCKTVLDSLDVVFVTGCCCDLVMDLLSKASPDAL